MLAATASMPRLPGGRPSSAPNGMRAGPRDLRGRIVKSVVSTGPAVPWYAPSQHSSMIANTHEILYTTSGRAAYPPGAPICGLLWGTGAPTCQRGSCAFRHMHMCPPRPSPIRLHARISPPVARASRGVFDSSIRLGRGGDSMRADKLSHPKSTYKEVTMFKRVSILTIAVAAFFVLVVPAMAWNGYREDYTVTAACCDLPHRHRHRSHRPSTPTTRGPSTTPTRRAPGPYGAPLRLDVCRLPFAQLSTRQGHTRIRRLLRASAVASNGIPDGRSAE